MKRYLLLAIFLLLASGCASEEERNFKELYELGKQEISERLISPTSAIYEDFDKVGKDFFWRQLRRSLHHYDESALAKRFWCNAGVQLGS